MSNKSAAITRIARMKHAANLISGGVVDGDGKNYSDYNTEKEIAKNTQFRWDGFKKLWISGKIAYA